MAKDTISAALVKHAKSLGYAAELRTPVVRPSLTHSELLARALEGTEPEPDRDEVRQWQRKLRTLSQHYGFRLDTEDGAFRALCAVLRDWVPGFAVTHEPSRGTGRPRRLTEKVLLETYEEIERLRLRTRRGEIGAACKKFKKNTGSNLDARTIENHYTAGRKLSETREQFFADVAAAMDSKTRRTKNRIE